MSGLIVTCGCGQKNRIPELAPGLSFPGLGKKVLCGACREDLTDDVLDADDEEDADDEDGDL
jgi:hypothetical protein